MKLIDQLLEGSVMRTIYNRSIARRQRDAYNLQKKSLDNNTILIELDWKQKILIGNF